MHTQELGAGRTVWADSVDEVSYYRAAMDAVDNAVVDSVCSLYALLPQRSVTRQELL